LSRETRTRITIVLRQRLVGAAAIIAPVLLLFWLDGHYDGGRPGIWLVPLGVVLAMIVAWELAELFSEQPQAPWPPLVAGGAAVVVLATAVGCLVAQEMAERVGLGAREVVPFAPWGWTATAAIGTLVATGVIEMYRYRQPHSVLIRLALTNLLINYVGLAFSFLFALRLALPAEQGLVALLSVVVITKCADTGAYFTGKSIGRHPMAPILSPKKTVEGAIGALVAAVLAAWLLHKVLLAWWSGGSPSVAPASFVPLIAYGVCLAAAGMIGDLLESLIKRDCQRKDSSSWLPGLGGLLDIFDSLMIAAPVGYLWWRFGLTLTA
jgi:phosphatidate cytidylyltransferase